MEFVCSNCSDHVIGPASLDGARCPSCGDGTLAGPGIIEILAAEGWHELPPHGDLVLMECNEPGGWHVRIVDLAGEPA